jgi:predicted dehydrogenase
MGKVRIGVVGAGTISDSHLSAYAARDDVELVAVADLNADRARKRQQEYGFTDFHDTAAALFARDDVDAVSICTWNNSHAELAIAALEAGKHVLCEKPLCKTVAEAEQVAQAVERTGKHLEIGYVRRYGRNAEVLKRFIDGGDLGEIYYSKASIIRRTGNPGGWFADVELSGGGPLIDIGVHCIDLAWWLMGGPKVTTVSANTYTRLGNRGNIQNIGRYKAADYDPSFNTVEDLANALVRFDNGSSMMVDVSFSLHAPQDSMLVAIYGDKGGAELEPQLKMVTEKYDTVLNLNPQIDKLSFDMAAFHREIGHFVELVKGTAEPMAQVSDGLEMMKILRAIYESADKGAEIVVG